MFRVRQTAVMVKIDGTIQCHTKTSKNDKWVESFEMHVDKATEVELVIYDQSGDKTLPIGLFWLKISDITECLRKQKVDHDHQDENWVSADEAQLQHNQHHTSSSSPSSSTSTTNSTNESHLSSTTTNSKNNSTHNQQSIKNKSILSNGIFAWFDVEPIGRIYLHVNFVREAGNRRPMDKLGRAGAVRERKGEIHESNGHQFITRRFYHIMKCALCNDFMTNFAYQCEGCSMACHRKCFDKVVTKCVSTELPSKEDDPEALRHRIPHRFEPLTIIGANWCCHCGSMLSLGFRGAHKCSECNIICHKKCTRFVPDFCGMTIEIASLMINEMRAANNRRSQFMDLSKLPANQLSHEHQQQQNLYHNTNHSTPTHGNASLSTSTTPYVMNNHHQHLNNRPFSIAFEPASYHSIPSLLGPSDNLHANKRCSQPLVPRKTTPLQLSKSGFGLDDFNLLAVLGKGNFGKVMLAEEKYTNNLYAIKILKKRFVLDNNEVESTRSEKRVFQIANQDRHPFLANLHSTFQTETRIYYVMEYISGGDLMMHIQHEQFSEKRARFYACEVLLALEYLHKHGIIYRDLKLDNIMLCLDGHVKLVDYGLCKENIWHNDTTNTFCGTPDFMAPEILLEQKYGRAVDWWAFGVLIYEMLLGQSPFKGEDEDEIFDAVLEDEILYPITMSKNCLSICQKLLERNPNRRLGSGKSDGLEIRQHPFFSGVNWDDILAKKVTPPYLPTVTGRADTSNFDEEFTREIPILTPVNAMLTKVEQQEFNQFSYIADWAINPA
ncbi:kinase-like domain-containing protein [Cunninghamella echinulata]|nr:kinase-like domain-containing protein [Cunninghamella echinulata]